MKKPLLLLLLVLALLSCACTVEMVSDAETSPNTESSPDAPSTSVEDAVVVEVCQVALLLDTAEPADQGYTGRIWEGITDYCEANGVTYAYYSAKEVTDEARLAALTTAAKDGADVIFCCGSNYEAVVYQAQTQYTGVTFVLFEGEPHAADFSVYTTAPNTLTLSFEEEQAGYLAGYAAVAEGYTDLAFYAGMAVDSAVRYGTGFLQGARAAAAAHQTKVTVDYQFTGMSVADASVQSAVGSLFVNNVQLIFSCDESFTDYITAAAEATGGKVISVETVATNRSSSVVASLVKNIPDVVSDVLADYFGGVLVTGPRRLGVAQDGLLMDMSNAKFANFTRLEYNQLAGKMKDGTLNVEIIEDPTVDVVTKYADWLTITVPQ